MEMAEVCTRAAHRGSKCPHWYSACGAHVVLPAGRFPKASRTITHEWFELLADLAYMRINYRHFNHSSLPGWTEGDSLLAQRIDMMVALTRALHAQEGSAGPALAAIREAFAPGGTG